MNTIKQLRFLCLLTFFLICILSINAFASEIARDDYENWHLDRGDYNEDDYDIVMNVGDKKAVSSLDISSSFQNIIISDDSIAYVDHDDNIIAKKAGTTKVYIMTGILLTDVMKLRVADTSAPNSATTESPEVTQTPSNSKPNNVPGDVIKPQVTDNSNPTAAASSTAPATVVPNTSNNSVSPSNPSVSNSSNVSDDSTSTDEKLSISNLPQKKIAAIGGGAALVLVIILIVVKRKSIKSFFDNHLKKKNIIIDGNGNVVDKAKLKKTGGGFYV